MSAVAYQEEEQRPLVRSRPRRPSKAKSENQIELLLDAQPDWWREPTEALFERLAQRNAQRDAAAKNS